MKPNEPLPSIRPIPIESVRVAEENVRRALPRADLDELKESIDKYGLQQPIVVVEREDRYDVLIGQRRFLAARELGWAEIPAIVSPEPDSELDSIVMSFTENVQRRELEPQDKARVCIYLLGQLGSVRAVAERLGVSRPTVRKWLGYAAVPPEIQELVQAKRITVPVATRLAQTIENPRLALEVAHHIASERPPKETRERILNAAEEYPERSLDVVLERASESKFQTRVTYVLPRRWAAALDRAAKERSMGANDLARELTVEWLQQRRY